jgi:hypothetical protein
VTWILLSKLEPQSTSRDYDWSAHPQQKYSTPPTLGKYGLRLLMMIVLMSDSSGTWLDVLDVRSFEHISLVRIQLALRNVGNVPRLDTRSRRQKQSIKGIIFTFSSDQNQKGTVS